MAQPTGVKHDGGKPRISLIPFEPLLEVAKVFTFGAKKYGDHNWRKGIVFSRLASASFRHRLEHGLGQDLDKESGIYHLAHAIANDMMELYFLIKKKKNLDDRYREKE